jgi:hypothetical protein
MKTVYGQEDIPVGKAHLAIIEFGTIYHEGDERSRTNPGHGYPAYTETTSKYIYYDHDERDKWVERIGKLMGVGQYSTKENFIALENGIRVIPKLNVEISI